ncbi:MAG: hypothetical protein HYV34_00315 [Candidatus Kerfeldbacteria bacterium]|nr:hypothetical protein [Candidatus Kerfeldbacteria bacterium]
MGIPMIARRARARIDGLSEAERLFALVMLPCLPLLVAGITGVMNLASGSQEEIRTSVLSETLFAVWYGIAVFSAGILRRSLLAYRRDDTLVRHTARAKWVCLTSLIGVLPMMIAGIMLFDAAQIPPPLGYLPALMLLVFFVPMDVFGIIGTGFGEFGWVSLAVVGVRHEPTHVVAIGVPRDGMRRIIRVPGVHKPKKEGKGLNIPFEDWIARRRAGARSLLTVQRPVASIGELAATAAGMALAILNEAMWEPAREPARSVD